MTFKGWESDEFFEWPTTPAYHQETTRSYYRGGGVFLNGKSAPLVSQCDDANGTKSGDGDCGPNPSRLNNSQWGSRVRHHASSTSYQWMCISHSLRTPRTSVRRDESPARPREGDGSHTVWHHRDQEEAISQLRNSQFTRQRRDLEIPHQRTTIFVKVALVADRRENGATRR